MKRRTRNFDGCWTCRNRKVKCDLNHPRCLRCTKLGLECEGYGIKLYWAGNWLISPNNEFISIGEHESRPETYQRRNVELMRFSRDSTYETFQELREEIQSFEDLTVLDHDQNEFRLGPFYGYRIKNVVFVPPKPRVPVPLDRPPPVLDQQHEPNLVSISEWRKVIANAISTDVDESFLFEGDAWVHPDLLDYAKLTIVALKGFTYRLSEQNMLHMLYPKFFPNVDLDDWEGNIKIVDKLYTIELKSNKLKYTPLFSSLRRLLLSRLFASNRVRFSLDYIDIVVVPYVGRIFDEFSDSEDRSLWTKYSPKCFLGNIKTAIMYGALGISAFHMSQEASSGQYTSPELLKISIELRKLCINILNRHLDDYDDNCGEGVRNMTEYKEQVLLALFFQVELDTRLSIFENYTLVLSMTDYIIKEGLSTDTALPPMTSLLVNIFQALNAFFESTQLVNLFDYNLDQQDEKIYAEAPIPEYDPLDCPTSYTVRTITENEKVDALNTNGRKRKFNSHTAFAPSSDFDPLINSDGIYLMYCGLPKLLIEIFHEIVRLTNHKNIFRQRKVFPKNFLRVCSDIETRLVNWSVEDSEWELDPDNPLHRCLKLYIESFHHAVIVYFNRLVKAKWAPERYQHHITRCLDLLDKLVDEMQGNPQVQIRPSFWILLVCGADALTRQLQQRIERMWQQELIWTSQPNYWRAKQILYEVWKRRLINENIGFMDLVREWEVQLCLA